MDNNFESVDVTDETNTTVTYYSETEVIGMKRISYAIGAITWFIIGGGIVLILCVVLGV